MKILLCGSYEKNTLEAMLKEQLQAVESGSVNIEIDYRMFAGMFAQSSKIRFSTNLPIHVITQRVTHLDIRRAITLSRMEYKWREDL